MIQFNQYFYFIFKKFRLWFKYLESPDLWSYPLVALQQLGLRQPLAVQVGEVLELDQVLLDTHGSAIMLGISANLNHHLPSLNNFDFYQW